MSAKRKAAYNKGVEAENAAARYLRLKGYEILERRYKTPVGEIDLIAARGETLVFAEVKSHKSEEQSLYAVNARSRRRIEAAASYYISMNEDKAGWAMRFDVLVVPQNAPKLLGPISVRHLDNAWMAGQ